MLHDGRKLWLLGMADPNFAPLTNENPAQVSVIEASLAWLRAKFCPYGRLAAPYM
jgi:hypothetical protein